MPRPTVLIDVDGPLANFTQAYLDALEQEVHAVHHVHEVDRWHIHECAFFVELEKSYVGLKRRVDDRISQPGFAKNIPVAPGAKEAVAELRKVADVYVVTSPWDSSPTWMHERAHWVHDHFGIPRQHVIQAARKHLIRGDVFVDDKPSHVVEWQAAWPTGLAVLFDMPHNRAENPDGVARAGWPFILGVVLGEAAGAEASPRGDAPGSEATETVEVAPDYMPRKKWEELFSLRQRVKEQRCELARLNSTILSADRYGEGVEGCRRVVLEIMRANGVTPSRSDDTVGDLVRDLVDQVREEPKR